MNDIKIAITGSYRDDEIKLYNFIGTKNDFFEKSYLLGKCLAHNGDALVTGWSNDYLSAQLSIDIDGHMKYTFEDSADYHAMRGYLDNNGHNLTLYISERLYNLFELYLSIIETYKNDKSGLDSLSSILLSVDTLNKGGSIEVELKHKNIESSINKLLQRGNAGSQTAIEQTYLGYLLRNANDTFIKLIMTKSDKIHIRKEIPENKLRTMILSDYVVENSDAVIIIGGGKATAVAAKETIAEDKFLLPLPEFGGESYKYLYNFKPLRHLKEKNSIPPEDVSKRKHEEIINYCNNYSGCFRMIQMDTIVEDNCHFYSFVKEIITTAIDPHSNKDFRIEEKIELSISGNLAIPNMGIEAKYIVEIPVDILPEQLRELLLKSSNKLTDIADYPEEIGKMIVDFIKKNRNRVRIRK